MVCSSREEVVRATRLARALAKERGWPGSDAARWDGICGAFSGFVSMPGAGDGGAVAAPAAVDERNLNGGVELRHAADARKARLLFVCQKFETGYDNPSLTYLYIWRQLRGRSVTQVLMRACRKRGGKRQETLDFSNAEDQVLTEVTEYWGECCYPLENVPRRVSAIELSEVEARLVAAAGGEGATPEDVKALDDGAQRLLRAEIQLYQRLLVVWTGGQDQRVGFLQTVEGRRWLRRVEQAAAAPITQAPGNAGIAGAEAGRVKVDLEALLVAQLQLQGLEAEVPRLTFEPDAERLHLLGAAGMPLALVARPLGRPGAGRSVTSTKEVGRQLLILQTLSGPTERLEDGKTPDPEGPRWSVLGAVAKRAETLRTKPQRLRFEESGAVLAARRILEVGDSEDQKQANTVLKALQKESREALRLLLLYRSVTHLRNARGWNEDDNDGEERMTKYAKITCSWVETATVEQDQMKKESLTQLLRNIGAVDALFSALGAAAGSDNNDGLDWRDGEEMMQRLELALGRLQDIGATEDSLPSVASLGAVRGALASCAEAKTTIEAKRVYKEQRAHFDHLVKLSEHAVARSALTRSKAVECAARLLGLERSKRSRDVAMKLLAQCRIAGQYEARTVLELAGEDAVHLRCIVSQTGRMGAANQAVGGAGRNAEGRVKLPKNLRAALKVWSRGQSLDTLTDLLVEPWKPALKALQRIDYRKAGRVRRRYDSNYGKSSSSWCWSQPGFRGIGIHHFNRRRGFTSSSEDETTDDEVSGGAEGHPEVAAPCPKRPRMRQQLSGR